MRKFYIISNKFIVKYQKVLFEKLLSLEPSYFHLILKVISSFLKMDFFSADFLDVYTL